MPTISEETHDRCAVVSDQGAEMETATEYDISKIMESDVNFKNLGRDMIYRILTAEINPEVSCYPHRAYARYFRQFQPAWKKQYSWLHYSKHVDGFFCHACVFFAPEKVGGQTPGQFVTKPFITKHKK